MRVAVAYTLFAVAATAANIGSQEASLRLHDGFWAVPVSVLVGTAVGLVVKYALDKRYIFRFTPASAVQDTQTFAFYSLSGAATTAVFWSFEFAFDYLFQTKAMRYLGGVLGLAIGYCAKYQLDKRYVFIAREA